MPQPLTTQEIDEKLLRLLVNRVEDYAIFMLDPNGFILSWNQGAEKIKGYESDEIIGQHISILYVEEDRVKNEPGRNLSLALKNNIHESEGWRLRKDGSKFWADIVYTTIYDDNGMLMGFAKITRDITARRKAENQKALVNAELERRVKANTDKVIARERRFRELIENSYDGITLLDKELKIFYRSRSAERINGWSADERSSLSLEDLVHPDDLEKVKTLFADVMGKPNFPFVATYRTLHKAGHYIWIECMLNNRFDDSNINAVVCNFRDVSDRVRAEELIKDKNAQIESILESITDGFIALDKNFCYTYANRKIGEMVGHPAEILIGKRVWDLFPDAVGSSTYLAFNKALETQQYTYNEDYYEPLELWQENHIYPSPDGLSVFIRDITERKLAEASLKQSESNLRSVFENTDQAIILFDKKVKVVSFNSKARTLAHKYFNAELQSGGSLYSYCTPERAAELKQVLQNVRERSTVTYETSYQVDGQADIWYEASWVNVLDNDDFHSGFILTMKDITYKKHADLERDRITADLIQRNQDLHQFTYIVSHNLRAPVANIQGLSDLLADQEQAADQQGDPVLKALATSIGNLDKVILDLNQILQMSGAANDTLEVVSLSSLVEDIRLETQQLTANVCAEINYDFKEVNAMLCLKSYLYSIFQNLIVNAIKYRRQHICPIVNISSKMGKDSFCIYFSDNGKGIDLERNQGKLFGLYKRFDLSVEGKGMGLFMVKMQVERLGGKITVESKINAGTTFKLEFPIKVEER
jgi:PAS domain S-box-containing protein